MATTGIMNSTLMRVLRDTGGGTFVATSFAKGADLNFSNSPRETSNKDGLGWQDFLEGMRGATISTNFLYAEDATEGFEELRTNLFSNTDRGLVTLQFTSNVSGDNYIQFSAYITELSLSSPEQEDNVTASASFQVTGVPTTGTVV